MRADVARPGQLSAAAVSAGSSRASTFFVRWTCSHASTCLRRSRGEKGAMYAQ
jgi:hypothetical protein